MPQITEQSPSRELFAALAVDCDWASNELEGRFDELLAACEMALQTIAETSYPINHETWDQLGAAIAKAKGVTP